MNNTIIEKIESGEEKAAGVSPAKLLFSQFPSRRQRILLKNNALISLRPPASCPEEGTFCIIVCVFGESPTGMVMVE